MKAGIRGRKMKLGLVTTMYINIKKVKFLFLKEL